MSAFRPTAEQQAVLDAFADSHTLGIEAGAGCAKTTTLEMLARSTPKTGRYLAFNKAIVVEAQQRFPMNVEASTIHSLAFGAVGREYAHRLDTPRMKPWDLARLLGVPGKGLVVTKPDGSKKVLQPSYLASLTMRAIRSFCQSDADEPTGRFVPYIDGIDPKDDEGRKSWANNDLVRAELDGPIRQAWADLSNVHGTVPFEHAHYLKLYERSEPRIEREFVMVDECQDVSPVMASIVEQSQEATGQQVVAVGDSQQKIYSFTGAINLFDRWEFDTVATLSQSFRFGKAVADVANVVLDEVGASLRIVGAGGPSVVGPVTDADVVLTRTNSAAVSTLLAFLKMGRKAHLIGGGDEVVRFARGAVDLMERGKSSHPDLACFDSWSEVQEYVENDPLGDDLALMVKLLDEYGAQIVLDALAGMPAEAAADVVVSTAHKAKGREWAHVRLAGDFPNPEATGRELSAEELRLLYVAVTRAKSTLDVRLCEPLVAMLRLPETVEPW